MKLCDNLARGRLFDGFLILHIVFAGCCDGPGDHERSIEITLQVVEGLFLWHRRFFLAGNHSVGAVDWTN